MIDWAELNIGFVAGTLGQGGAERQLYYIVTTLKRLGAHPFVLSLTKGEFWESHIQASGVPVIWVGKNDSRLLRLYRIITVLRKQKPHFLQSQHFYTNLYVTLASRLLNIRESGAIRNDCLSEVKVNGPFWGRLSLRLPRMIIANSQVAIGNAVALGVTPHKLRMLANVVDTKYFQPASDEGKESVCILAVGRLVHAKRLDRFLEILAVTRAQSSVSVTGVIAGDGPERESLYQQAQQLGLLPDGVKFLGTVNDMKSVYKTADILVLTSDWEGTPNVILEAMACGLPVVATNVGGTPEIIKDGITGYLVAADNYYQMTSLLLSLVNDRSKQHQMGRAARQYVETNHALYHFSDYLHGLYKGLLR